MKTSEAKRRAVSRYKARKRLDPKWRAEQRVYFKNYRQANREALSAKDRVYQRANNIRINLRRLGLPLELEGAIRKHHGRCDICGGKPTGRWGKLLIDHCHARLRFRGMLCTKCNHALGLFGDDPALLRNAITYLKQDVPPWLRKLIQGEAVFGG